MSCHVLERGSSADCDNLPIPGTEARLILINYDDVEKIYYNDNGNITLIEMVPETVAYEFIGFKQDVRKSESVVAGNLKNRFTHAVDFVVYEITQVQKNNLRKMAKGRLMAIVELSGKEDYSIELLGRECGLKMAQGVIKDVHVNGGMYTISLRTPDNGIEFERRLPQVVGLNYSDGLDIINDILEPEIDTGIFDETFDSTFE